MCSDGSRRGVALPCLPGGRRVIVLGCDPGYASFGWARVELSKTGRRCLEHGTIRTQPVRGVLKGHERIARSRVLRDELIRVSSGCTVVAAETFGTFRSSQAAIGVSLAWGVIVGALGHLPIVGVTFAEVKKAATGMGRASKEDMRAAVFRAYGWGEGPPVRIGEHAVDALAVVLASEASEVVRMGRSGSGDG